MVAFIAGMKKPKPSAIITCCKYVDGLLPDSGLVNSSVSVRANVWLTD